MHVCAHCSWWAMLRHIAITTRDNRRRYERMFDAIALPKIRLGSVRAIRRFYQEAGLRVPGVG